VRLEWEWGDLVDAPKVMCDGVMQTITSTWMGPIRQVLCDISRAHRDHASINVSCPHDDSEFTGLKFQAGPPRDHWDNHGEPGWPVIHCCFCKRCTHAMSQYDDN